MIRDRHFMDAYATSKHLTAELERFVRREGNWVALAETWRAMTKHMDTLRALRDVEEDR